MNENLLKLKIGSATANPNETARRKRKMKGAERRMATHKVRVERYRKIIAERAVQSISKDGGIVTVYISEPEWNEYRMKRLTAGEKQAFCRQYATGLKGNGHE